MALEHVHETYWHMSPGPLDVHGHPRVFDAITPDNFVPENGHQEGKAGLRHYTEVALQSGITAVLAMPNESVRLYNESVAELTTLIPFPIATRDRVLAMAGAISHEAVIGTGIYMGLDPDKAFANMYKTRLDYNHLEREFRGVNGLTLGLKIYLAETTGGNNIALDYAPTVMRIWHRTNPEKPVTVHVEGEDVATFFEGVQGLKEGKEIPIHVAHVSSRQELEAVIQAKKEGMNVSAEATPHHLFLDGSVVDEIGGFGCMKPGLKTQEDIDFLWSNLEHIDMFASDCAPHRRSDKLGASPAYGVTNHTVMLPLLLGAVQEGRLSMDDVYQKLCVNPRRRFNLPLDDGSLLGVSTQLAQRSDRYERGVRYGFNPFTRIAAQFAMVGEVVTAQAAGGESHFSATHGLRDVVPSYAHLLKPRDVGLSALKRRAAEETVIIRP